MSENVEQTELEALKAAKAKAEVEKLKKAAAKAVASGKPEKAKLREVETREYEAGTTRKLENGLVVSDS